VVGKFLKCYHKMKSLLFQSPLRPRVFWVGDGGITVIFSLNI
jgi:hypothetical protein